MCTSGQTALLVKFSSIQKNLILECFHRTLSINTDSLTQSGEYIMLSESAQEAMVSWGDINIGLEITFAMI